MSRRILWKRENLKVCVHIKKIRIFAGYGFGRKKQVAKLQDADN